MPRKHISSAKAQSDKRTPNGQWIRATVYISPDILDTLREEAVRQDRFTKLYGRFRRADPVSEAIEKAVDIGLRAIGNGRN